MEKRDIPRFLHNYLIGSLVKIRAFNFSNELCAIIEKYLDFLIVDRYESYKKLLKLRQYFGICFDRLSIKS